MVTNVADALLAYKQGGGLSGLSSSGVANASGESFGDFLKSFATDTVKSLETGEKAATDAATGKANVANVITAINDASLKLQEIVTIRDKVIAAYQSISQAAI